MIRNATYVLVACAVTASAGCAGDGSTRLDARRDPTLAALAKYPGNPQKSDDIQVVAIDRPGDKKLELANLTDRSVTFPTVWVNGAYVARAETIPPRGQVTVKYSELIEQGRSVQDLAAADGTVNTVELQTPQGLFTVLGPTRR